MAPALSQPSFIDLMNRLPVSSTVNIDRHHVSVSPLSKATFLPFCFSFPKRAHTRVSIYIYIYIYIDICTCAFCARPRRRQTLDDSSRVELEFHPIEMSVPTKPDHPRRLSKRKRSSAREPAEDVLVSLSLLGVRRCRCKNRWCPPMAWTLDGAARSTPVVDAVSNSKK